MPEASQWARQQARRPSQLSLVSAVFAALALAGCAAQDSTTSSRSQFVVERSRPLQARIIYIAERHNEPFHHQLQERIIRCLHERGVSVTVGMEMIDVTQQPALDDYLAKRISWSTFARSTGFASGWGQTSPAYKRILEWCRGNEVPVVGLNAPQFVTRKIARNQRLTSAEAALIPKFPEPPGGFKKFRTAMAGHPGSGSVRRYYQAQRAWDATMAGRILSWLRDRPGTLVVLLGQIHADPRTGVPWYVAKNSDVPQAVVYAKE